MKIIIKNKYRNKITEVDGIKFHSKAESEYYIHLKYMVKIGQIRYFLRQIPIHLPGNVKYIVDFFVVTNTGDIEYIDVKGKETDIFKMKKKQVESLYNIKIKVLKKRGNNFVEV